MSRPAQSTIELRQSALYVIRLFLNGSPYVDAVPGAPAYAQGEFQLPLPPQQVKLEARSRHQLTPLGLALAVDEHGVTPPEISISGTFGESVRNLRDGRQWQRELEALCRYYLEENYRRGRAREPLLRMSWHDTYRSEHWYVHPVSVPYGSQDVSSPYREQYQLRLQALARYEGAVPKFDPLTNALEPSQHGNVLAARNPNASISTSDPKRAETPEGTNITGREIQLTMQPLEDRELTQIRNATVITALEDRNYERAERVAAATTWDELSDAVIQTIGRGGN